MMAGVFSESTHRRWNPLRRDWVLVSPHRTQRPWQGQTEETAQPQLVHYDSACYLCPGNKRASGRETPKYEGMGLCLAVTERGICRVVCFDPQHDLTLATMDVSKIRRVVDVLAAQEAELAGMRDISYVQIFENRGSMIGASNPHPHGQIWATASIPNEPLLELESRQEYSRNMAHCSF